MSSVGETAAPCLSVVMPCYNEAATIEAAVARVLDLPFVAELVIVDDGSTDGTREILGASTDPRIRVFLQPRQPGQGGGPAHGIQPAARRRRASSRTPTSSTIPPSIRALLSRSSTARPTSSTARASSASRTACSTSGTALGNKIAHAAVEHVHQPEPDRHGDLLQGLPPRGASTASRSRRTASASSRRSPPRSPALGVPDLRGRHLATTAAPTTKARRSAGRTASRRSPRSASTPRSGGPSGSSGRGGCGRSRRATRSWPRRCGPWKGRPTTGRGWRTCRPRTWRSQSSRSAPATARTRSSWLTSGT